MKNRNYTVTIGTWVYRTNLTESEAEGTCERLRPLVLNAKVRRVG